MRTVDKCHDTAQARRESIDDSADSRGDARRFCVSGFAGVVRDKTKGNVMETIKAFWVGLTSTQRTLVIVFVAVILIAILGSFVFAGTDYAGFGDWLQSWR